MKLTDMLERPCDCSIDPVPFLNHKSYGLECPSCGAAAWTWRDVEKSKEFAKALFGVDL